MEITRTGFESLNRTLPIVSIVMPAYNSDCFIGDAIDSVLSQTMANWELIVVDDCSTDRTWAILKDYAERDKRIIPMQNDRNHGSAWSRNKAFEKCRGKFVALLDSDDLWKPDKLERQVEIATRTGADIVYCSYSMIDESGVSHWNDFIVPKEITYEQALSRSVMSCSTSMLTSQIIKDFKFSETMYHEDLLYWLTLLREGKKAVGITEVLASYRIRLDSRASDKFQSAINRWRVYRYLGLSRIQSWSALWQYIQIGLKKYRKTR